MQHQIDMCSRTTPSPCSTLSSTNTPPRLISHASSACSFTSSPNSLIVISSESDSSDDSDMNSSHSKSPNSPSCYITSVTSPPPKMVDNTCISPAVTDTLLNSTTPSMLTNEDTAHNPIDSSSVLSSKSSIAVLHNPAVSQAHTPIRPQPHTLDSRTSSSPPEEAVSSTASPLSLQCRMDRFMRKDNKCYIMDAKKKGNVGRFINVSEAF